MRCLSRCVVVFAQILIFTAFPVSFAGAAPAYSDDLTRTAKQLADRVDSFHATEVDALVVTQPDYCSVMLRASATMRSLAAAEFYANARGDTAAAAAYRKAGDDLGDELDYEDWLDDEFGPKAFCSASAFDVPYVTPPGTYAAYSGVFIQPTVQFGIGSNSFGNSITTTLPSEASGDVHSTVGSVALDLRVNVPVVDRTSIVFGGTFTDYFRHTATGFFDLDAISPGNDTTVKLKEQYTLMPYGGLSLRVPTWSALLMGNAGQPGSGTFNVTAWAGYRFDRYSGSLATDELGLVRQTDFTKNVNGYSVGLDVDYPLWQPGTQWLWTPSTKPVIRAGVQFNHSNTFSVTHESEFATYNDTLRPKDSWQFNLGLAVQYYPRGTALK